jgi:hypothetical protein
MVRWMLLLTVHTLCTKIKTISRRVTHILLIISGEDSNREILGGRCHFLKKECLTLEVIGIGKDFLNRTPAAQQLREIMDKWDFKN